MCIICITTSGGCRRAAYTELYIEQLNSEARLLEDRIYEYDSAYRELELEVQSLHSENERLRGQIASDRSPPLRSRKSSPNIEYEEIPPRSNAPAAAPKDKPKVERSNTNPTPTPPKQTPKVIESEPLEPPKIELPSPPSILNDTSSTDAVGTSVNYLAVSQSRQRREAIANEQAVIQAVAVTDVPPSSQETVEISDEVPEEVSTAAAEEINESAEVEMQFPVDVDGNIEDQQAYAPHLATAEVTNTASASDADQQVVELMFHPAFTRAIDADKTPGEESIRMILQPKLASGKVIPVDGHLTIVVVDPNATNPDNPDAPVSLGRWTFTPEQLQQYFDPVGSACGYRFEMGPLQSKPTKSELIIFVRLEYEDGRKLVNQFTIHPDSNPTDKPIWTARAK